MCVREKKQKKQSEKEITDKTMEEKMHNICVYCLTWIALKTTHLFYNNEVFLFVQIILLHSVT